MNFYYICTNNDKMKRIVHILAIVLAALLCFSCHTVRQTGDISIISYRVTKAMPMDYRTIDMAVDLELKNNGLKVSLDAITGEFMRNGVELGKFKINPVEIPGSSITQVNVSGTIYIDRNINLMSIMAMAQSFNPSEFTISFRTTAKVGPVSKFIEKDGIALSEILRK